MDNLLPMVSDYVPENGSIIRTDNAPAFQKLVAMSSQDNSVFKNLNITLQLGDALDPNKNPIAENAVKELEKEFLRLNLSNKQIQPVTLSLAVKNINSRIRQRGLSSREMCFMCSQTTNDNIKLNDVNLITTQTELRKSKHNKTTRTDSEITIGSLVMVKDKLHKNEARDKYVVIELENYQDVPYANLKLNLCVASIGYL